MADKISSPSSSSNGGGSTNNQTPQRNDESSSALQGKRDVLEEGNYLQVRQQPPTYVFGNEIFEIHVGLEVTRLTGDSPTGTEVELRACLLAHPVETTTDAAEQAATADIGRLVVVGSKDSDDNDNTMSHESSTVSTSRPCRLRCKILLLENDRIPLVRRDKRVSCLIRISTRDGTHEIASTMTTVIQVVNYKLRIAIDSTWSNIWYKDEGGRDKSMEAVAELYSRDNVQHRERVPLRLTLYYSPQSGASNVVGRHQQNLVKVTNQEILRSLGSSSKLYTDKSTGKATIRFRIEDVSKNHQGQDFVLQIAPDYRKGFLDVAPGLTPSVSVRSKRNKRQRTTTVGGRPERRGSSPVEQSHTSSVDGGRSSFGDHPVRSVWGQDVLSTADPARLREAMQGIVHWTDEVVNGLYPLQWQILGYAQHPDGSPDYSRPHYSMNNPNACISRVLATYAESTRENLWVLSQAVEQAAGNHIQSGGRERYGHHSPNSSYATPSSARGLPPQSLPPAVHAHAAGHTPPGMIPPSQAAATMGSISVSGGMHPSIASEAFRPKRPMMEPHTHLHHHSQSQQQHHGGHASYASPQGQGHLHSHLTSQHAMTHPYYQRQIPTQAQRVLNNDSESNLQPEPFPPATIQAIGDANSHGENETYRRQDSQERNELESRESEVEYVLAKEYKALRTGERLGFPAYTGSREIVGFYRESRIKVGVGEFTPISRHSQDFGPMEIMQASEILEEAIAKKSSAVHSLKDWGSIANLIDHALVYDWTKDISTAGGTGHSQSGSEDGE